MLVYTSVARLGAMSSRADEQMMYVPSRSSSRWAVVQVQRGRVKDRLDQDGKSWETAIYKKAVMEPIEIGLGGLAGDQQTGVDADRAVCAHSLAHYKFWQSYFSRRIPVGLFGENLTIDGAIDEEVCVGDVIRCGTVVMQVTQPRVPCYKQAKRLGEPRFVKLIEQTNRRGFLLRVLEPGTLQVGNRFKLIERPYPRANLLYVNRIRFERTDPDAMRWLAALPPLAHDWRADVVARLEKLGAAAAV